MTETTAVPRPTHSQPASVMISKMVVCATIWLFVALPADAAASRERSGSAQPIAEQTSVAQTATFTADVHGPATLADRPLYRLLPDGRLQHAVNGGTLWQDAAGLPTRVLPAERAGEPLPATAFAVDPSDANHVLIAVGARVFRSTDAGNTWTEAPLGGVINQSTYVTAAAIDPHDPERWIVGTSYDGLYLTADAGETWLEMNAEWQIDEFYLGAGFHDEVEAVQINDEGTAIVQVGMGGGFVSVDLDAQSALRLRPVVDGERAYRAPARSSNVVRAGAGHDGTGGSDTGNFGAAEGRRALAAGRTGIYVAAPNAAADQAAGYLEYIVSHGFDSIVVDLKDDYGRVTYDTSLPMPHEVGAVTPQIDVSAIVEAAHSRGIYVIARIVLFKDRRLYRYEGGRLALWDSSLDRPWGVYRTVTDEETGEERVVQVEHWVDPYSEEVRQYNIAIAEEAVSLGVDEIQFDYVRFPSDGITDTLVSRLAPEGADRVQALETFLSEARSRIDVPIGIDVFGFNAWSRMSYLGQDITRLARYVDVISPMFYPSHFALPFLPRLSYLERSRTIYHDGTRRARLITASAESVLIRPYVQAFLIGAELDYEEPEYRRYLSLQIQGSESGVASGYTLWNASGRYYMLP